MRVLGVDEIPEEWIKQLDNTGIGRYRLFFDDINSQPSFVSEKTRKGVMDTLEGIRGSTFPYKDLVIGKQSMLHWKRLNDPLHVGVLMENNFGVLLLLEGTLDESLFPTEDRDYGPLNI